MKLPKYVQPHTATIKPFEGEGAYGPVWGDEYETTGYIQREREVVLDDEGNEIVSDVQWFTSDMINPKPQSELTFEGETFEVMTVAQHDSAFGGSYSHTEIHLR